MPNFTAGTSFTDGVTNDVTAAKLNALVADATPTSSLALASTSGTISNFTSSTATLLGAITGSTNVINIGSGQIYKDASANVGIGTASPSAKLNVYDASSATFSIQGDSTTQALVQRSSVDSASPILTFKKTRGSIASPSAVITGDFLGIIEFQAYGGTNNRILSRVLGQAETYVSDTNISSNLIFQTSNVGAATPTEKMRIDSSGNVGIGTTSPARQLSVSGASAALGITSTAAGGNTVSIDPATTANSSTAQIDCSGANALRFNTNSTERLRIDSSGNVGIGTGGSTAASKLDVYGVGNFQGLEVGKSGQTGNRYAGIDFTGDDTYTDYGFRIIRDNVGANANNTIQTRGTGQLALSTQEAGPIVMSTTSTERLRIDGANGTLTSQPTYDNTAAGSAVVVTSAGLIRRTSSSLKYKKDIENLDSSIVDNAIDRLRPVWYRTKNPEGDDKSTWSHVGLIAEEVNSVEPRLVRYKTVEVSTNENGERIETQLENPVPEDVDYARLSVVLLSEVKAQRVKIASLEARLEALESK